MVVCHLLKKKKQLAFLYGISLLYMPTDLSVSENDALEDIVAKKNFSPSIFSKDCSVHKDGRNYVTLESFMVCSLAICPPCKANCM